MQLHDLVTHITQLETYSKGAALRSGRVPEPNYFYLATPYSKYKGGLEEAYQEAAYQASRLIKVKLRVFCPIAHTHPIAIAGGMDPLDHTIWLPADEPLMKNAFGLIVAQMPGWDESYGIGEEIKYFESVHKPIFYWDCSL